MTRIWSVGLAAVLAVSGLSTACGSDDDGGASPQQACNDLATTFCARAFECFDSATLALIGYTSQSQCVEKTKTDEGCASKTTDNACMGSEKYHADKASKCVTQVKDASCAQIMAGDESTFAPACNEICVVD